MDDKWALLIGYPRRLSLTALRQTCCRCLGPCWVTPESLRAAEEGKREVRYACLVCAPVLVPREMKCEPLTPGQMAEIKERGLNVTQAEADQEINRHFDALKRVTN